MHDMLVTVIQVVLRALVVIALQAKGGCATPTGRRKRAGKRPHRRRTRLLGPNRRAVVMTIQRSHGKAYAVTPPPDEVAVGVPAPPPAESGPVERRSNGQVAGKEAAQALGRRGGRRTAEKAAQLELARIGLSRLLPETADPSAASELAGIAWPTDPILRPRLEEAEAWLRSALETLARDVGGGQLSPIVVSMVQSAAWQRAAGLHLMDVSTRRMLAWVVKGRDFEGPRTDIVLAASRLLEASKCSLVAAEDTAAKEAEARLKAPGADDPLYGKPKEGA